MVFLLTFKTNLRQYPLESGKKNSFKNQECLRLPPSGTDPDVSDPIQGNLEKKWSFCPHLRQFPLESGKK